MKNKALLLTGVAIGYVVGSRSGRGGYETVKRQAKNVWGNPTVQRQVGHAQEAVKDAVREQAPVVQSAVQDGLHTAAHAVSAKASSLRPGSHPDNARPGVEDAGSGI